MKGKPIHSGRRRREESQTEDGRPGQRLVTSSPTSFREDSAPYHVNGNGSHNELRFIDLFCGIGGFRLAFEKAGCQCVFSSDWNEKAQETYAANFGEKPHGDIHSVAIAQIPEHDILCAGFPCQPFSIAGVSKKLSLSKKHGFEDKEQGNLFFTLADIINVHQPAASRLAKFLFAMFREECQVWQCCVGWQMQRLSGVCAEVFRHGSLRQLGLQA